MPDQTITRRQFVVRTGAAATGATAGIYATQPAAAGENSVQFSQVDAAYPLSGKDGRLRGVLSRECEGQGGAMIERSLKCLRGVLIELKIPVGG